MPDETAVPPGIDISRPHAARVYDWALGGKTNYPADREYGQRVVAATPEYPRLARANRGFLERSVRFLAESGITQFLDLGTGIPTTPSVHEVARMSEPTARVVYVDNDPIVSVHNEALLATDRGVSTLLADVRKPAEILDHPQVQRLIDFDRPVAVLLVAVFHVIQDRDDPDGIIRSLRDRLAPGSHLAFSQLTSDSDPEAVAQTEAATADSPIPVCFRSRERISGFFAGFELVEPGLVPVQQWRPVNQEPATRLDVLGGVGRRI